MRPTLRKAAGQVFLIMKVSIQFLKNAEKSKDSAENDTNEEANGGDSETKKEDGDETAESKTEEGDKQKKGKVTKIEVYVYHNHC